MRVFAISAVLVFVLDQLSKWLVVHVLDLKARLAVDVLPPVLNFRMGWNRGINFGLFGDSPETVRYILIVFALLVCLFVTLWARKTLSRAVTFAGAGALVGGALGNVLDRVLYGAVADFLNMSCCGITNPFTFNVADIGIFVGVAILLVFNDDKTA